ncbi:MAG: hypothetical protein AABZ53_05295 [Planctomycetota bacterium]
MNRHRAILILLTLLSSWYAMMIVHECGHILAALATGSKIDRVLLPWIGFSQTEISKYVHPTFVVAAGPALGVTLPLAAWLACHRLTWAPLLRFFAGFCLVANGGYIASAIVHAAGDADDLVALGVPSWILGVAGCISVAAGLQLWNGLAPSFGLAPTGIPAGSLRRASFACALVLALVLAVNVF